MKAQAIEQAAQALLTEEISSCQDIRTARSEDLALAERGWRRVPGQSSGTSWRYLLMLAGRPGVKPDRMIIRFVAAALERPASQVSTGVAASLVAEAATGLGATPTRLDHAIWRKQSGRDSGAMLKKDSR